MITKEFKLDLTASDDEFNSIYPEYIQKLSNKHWTRVAVAKVAAEFLVTRPGTRVLDIGSGVGKFCMVGEMLTQGHFTGVEYRRDLVDLSGEISKKYNLENCQFIHENITKIDFRKFNAFYFFNSFIEQMSESEVMDDAVPISPQLYGKYNQYLRLQFAGMPVGTRLATYWGNSEEVPKGYMNVGSAFEGELKMWEKMF